MHILKGYALLMIFNKKSLKNAGVLCYYYFISNSKNETK